MVKSLPSPPKREHTPEYISGNRAHGGSWSRAGWTERLPEVEACDPGVPTWEVRSLRHPTAQVRAGTWLAALGMVLGQLGLIDGLSALVCERSGAIIIANDVGRQLRFTIQRVP